LLNESAQDQEVVTAAMVLPKPCLTLCTHPIAFSERERYYIIW
jgi:hypothetical protein